MAVQFYRKEARTLVRDGERIFLDKGDVGYVRAGRVHDAKYIDACQLVYVHNGAFAFRSRRCQGRLSRPGFPHTSSLTHKQTPRRRPQSRVRFRRGRLRRPADTPSCAVLRPKCVARVTAGDSPMECPRQRSSV